MTINSLISGNLKGNLGMVQNTLADWSDADFFVRPTPKANHATWQLGHLAFFETMVANLVSPGSVPACPEDWAQKFNKPGAGIDDPAQFPKPRALLEILAKARKAIAEYAAKCPASDFDNDSPADFRSFAPKLGNLLSMCTDHTCMHLGQFQVIRRHLGKPVIF